MPVLWGWGEFKQTGAELAQHEQEGKRLADIAKKQPLTLLYAAKTPRRTMRWCLPLIPI